MSCVVVIVVIDDGAKIGARATSGRINVEEEVYDISSEASRPFTPKRL